MVTILAAPAAGSDLSAIWTAIGTIALAVVAVFAPIYTERRASKRLTAEHERSDKVLAEERALADRRLAEQLAHSDAQLAEERTAADKRLADEIRAADKRLAEERQAELDREQWAEAYLIQVTPARVGVVTAPGQIASDVERPVVIVVNHGRYAITRVQAQLYDGASLTEYGKTEHLSSWYSLPEELRPKGIWEARSFGRGDTLTPMDLGLRYTADPTAVKFLVGSYPLVRWTDRWGTHWEHRRGEVRKIDEGEPWSA
jgi:hypothetical protein